MNGTQKNVKITVTDLNKEDIDYGLISVEYLFAEAVIYADATKSEVAQVSGSKVAVTLKFKTKAIANGYYEELLESYEQEKKVNPDSVKPIKSIDIEYNAVIQSMDFSPESISMVVPVSLISTK